MAKLSDFLDIAGDIAELFRDASGTQSNQGGRTQNADRTGKAAYKTYNFGPGGTRTYVQQRRPQPQMQTQTQIPQDEYTLQGMAGDEGDDPSRTPMGTENVTEEDYCGDCIEERDALKPMIRFSPNELAHAVVLSELLAPPLALRGRGMRRF